MNFIIVLFGISFFYNCGSKNRDKEENIIGTDYLGNCPNENRQVRNILRDNKSVTEEEIRKKNLESLFIDISKTLSKENVENARKDFEEMKTRHIEEDKELNREDDVLKQKSAELLENKKQIEIAGDELMELLRTAGISSDVLQKADPELMAKIEEVGKQIVKKNSDSNDSKIFSVEKSKEFIIWCTEMEQLLTPNRLDEVSKKLRMNNGIDESIVNKFKEVFNYLKINYSSSKEILSGKIEFEVKNNSFPSRVKQDAGAFFAKYKPA